MSQPKQILSTIINTLTLGKYIVDRKLIQIKHSIIKSFVSIQFLIQLIIYYIIICIIIGFVVIYVRIFIYPIILTTSYSTGYQMQFSDDVIQSSIENILQSSIKIESNARSENELSQIILIKIYLQELIRHKLVEGLSFVSLTNYSTYHTYLNSKDANYTIDEGALGKMMDDNKKYDNINEIEKVSFMFIPLLIQESFINDNILSSVYILPYTFNKNTLKYIKQAYFQYPTLNNLYTPDQNFFQVNKMTDPLLNDSVTPSDPIYAKNWGDEYMKVNWYVLRDYFFRLKSKASNEPTLSNLAIYNQAKISSDMINRSHYEVLQFSPNNNEPNPIVINLVFKYNEKVMPNYMEHFSFLLQNTSFDLHNDELVKYSDNSTYVITKNAISPFEISDKYADYFNYVFDRKDGLFSANGANFDTFDIELFDEVEDYFTIPIEKQTDVLVFKTMVLIYASTIIKSRSLLQPVSDLASDRRYYILNYNDTDGIKSICDSIGLFKHYLHLKSIKYKTNCFSNAQMFFYLQAHGMEYDTTQEGSLPDCVCLPFYCLNITQSNIKEGQIEYTDSLSFPNRCYSPLNSYYSPFLTKQISNRLEGDANVKNLIAFQYKSLPYLKSVDLLNVHNAFNYHNINAEAILTTEINNILASSMIINIIVYCLIIIIFLLVTIFTTKRKNMLLSTFVRSHEEYLFQRNSEAKKKNCENFIKEVSSYHYANNLNKSNNLLNTSHQVQEYYEQDLNGSNEGITLISDLQLTKENDLDEEHTLIDDLFETYCEIYKKNKETLIKKLEKDREKEEKEKEKRKDKDNINEKGKGIQKPVSLAKLKRNFFQKKNELFELLAWFSYSMPNNKLSIKSEINFYKSHPLIKKYILTRRKFIRTIPGISLKPNKNVFGISQSILCELLSTESIFDEGVIINLKYNFKNYHKSNDFGYLSSPRKKKTLSINKKFLLKEKKRDGLFNELEMECKPNDVFKLDEMKSAFNYYLTEVFYICLKTIYKEVSYDKSRKLFSRSKS